MIGGTKLELRNMNSIHKRLSLLFVLLYLQLRSGHSLLITFPRDTEVLVNHSTYFNCSTSILSEQIHWYHFRVGENQTNYVYYKGQFNQIYADRFFIEINNKTGEYNLIIRSVQPGDAGRYVCQDDVGLGHSSPAELIVLESPPTCLFSMKPDGFVGPNSCDLPVEQQQLSCSVSYVGNIPPILQWKMSGTDAPILEGATADYSGKPATVNLTKISTVEMDGKFFTCGAARYQDKQFSCSTDPAKINYAVDVPTILNIAKGETITCAANASVPCTYRWFYDNDAQNPVSYNKVLTTNRLGNHSCEASCPINGINCTFVAMRIIVIEKETSKDTTKTLLDAILIPIVAILLIIACVLFFRMGKAGTLKNIPTYLNEVTPLNNESTTADNGSEKETSFAEMIAKSAQGAENVALRETAVQSSGQMKQPPCTSDEESNEVPRPNMNPSTYNKGETQSLLTAGTEPKTTDEVTTLRPNESTSVDNGAEKEASFAGVNNIIQTHFKEEEITTKASREMGRFIAGVGALDEMIYVVSHRSSEVEMFDSRTYEYKDRRILEGLENPWDLTSCRLNRCLYIMDFRSATASKYVIGVDSNVKVSVQWSTGEEYGNLSVTNKGNVIVTICESRRLVIYSPDGAERTVVSLSDYLIHPTHALKLSNGQFLICHGINKDNVHRLCILNEDGEIIKSSFERMDEPSHLAVDDTGLIFVADQRNNRVIVLNSDLELKGEVASRKNGLLSPHKICLNVKAGKLLVVDNEVLEFKRRNGKLLIFPMTCNHNE